MIGLVGGGLCHDDAPARAEQHAVVLPAAGSVTHSVAVTLVKACLSAKSPDGVLHETGEHGREVGIEAASVDLSGNPRDDVRATIGGVTVRSIEVAGIQSAKYAGSVKPVVDQRVDRRHGCAGGNPPFAARIARQQQHRQAHAENLVGQTVDVAQRRDHGIHEQLSPVRRSWPVRLLEPGIDPADQVATGHVPHKKPKTIRSLIEAAISEGVLW